MIMERLLLNFIPRRIRAHAKVVTDLQEWLKYKWLADRVKTVTCVRSAKIEEYGTFPIESRWARSRGGVKTKFTYEIQDAELVLRTGLVAINGWAIPDSIGNSFNAAFSAIGYRMAKPLIRLSGRYRKLDDNRVFVYLWRHLGYYHFVMEALVGLIYSLRTHPNACLLIDKKQYDGYLKDYVTLLQQAGLVTKMEFVDAAIVKIPDFVLTAAESDSGMFCRETVDILRQTFLQIGGGVPGKKRIFITRRRWRAFENQPALEKIAVENGFDIIDTDGMPVPEQIALFSGADYVVANHGAGLTNLVFAKPGISVLELFSEAWLNDCYFRLASICGIRYGCLIADASGKWGRIDESEFLSKIRKSDAR